MKVSVVGIIIEKITETLIIFVYKYTECYRKAFYRTSAKHPMFIHTQGTPTLAVHLFVLYIFLTILY